MMMSAKPVVPVYVPTHVRTEKHQHVWKEVATGRFVCEDETNCFFGDYATEQEAAAALLHYCETILGTGPAKS